MIELKEQKLNLEIENLQEDLITKRLKRKLLIVALFFTGTGLLLKIFK
ncbi:SVM protein signal sequence [Moritella viscosa]|uniref:SVM protein signal sequence n=1 Tax=Moritella viscosa TaxID=80854 RepID=A0A1L0AFZ6_9GAMM|nr:hypothetical protein [Moritella viscosa]SGY86087.1 SVM protein signal sequence [Moritella viscosa]SHN98360.1 SVM protein signal sequence [Moritella viscosa]SHN98367.1 SVM protein signal sequence [Moritella viscosa]SHN98377.1 SVM protein signal sequence [Moritella viscosa]SHN99249.1 SVM protein signal sequence [Moritella viscosa]